MEKMNNQMLIGLIKDLKPEIHYFEIYKSTDKQKYLDLAKNNKELIVLINSGWRKK